MSVLVQVLLTLLLLSACLGDVVTPQPHTLRSRTLKETMKLLEKVQREVSCDKVNVINIFADHKRGNNTDIFCKAATIARETKSCHRELGGIYYNLLSLGRARHKKPCPVAPGSTTSLKNFLKALDYVLQEEFKSLK
ncbi:interleukin-4-like [Ammospiza nelsoni]|uniref:interleukin-4-like n=1 Tax=Ammospiza nelsoni TaxID=2857394 RepID=UPI002869E5F0|nr:interleukin-4-like [Ammospiza nelsoni]